MWSRVHSHKITRLKTKEEILREHTQHLLLKMRRSIQVKMNEVPCDESIVGTR